MYPALRPAVATDAPHHPRAMLSRTYPKRTRIDWNLAKSAPIVQVLSHIGQSVSPSGAGRCPLPNHNDTRPSFRVYKDENSWYCFACGVGGSVIDLVMHCMSMDARTAALWLQNEFFLRASLSHDILPTRVPPTSGRAAKNGIQGAVTANSDILEWMLSFCTLNDTGRTYLRTRYISDATIDNFKVRQFGPINDFVLEAKRLWSDEQLINTGLLKRNRAGNSVSCPFRTGQLIFPFFENERCVYFQTRTTAQEKTHRWMNPAGLPVCLYNCDILNNIGRKRTVYLCEGVTDVMSAHELGWNAVGLVGVNSLKREWLPRFRGLDVHILFDRDTQGERRSKEYLRLFAEQHISAVRQVLPVGSDLNDFLIIRKTRGKT